VVDQREGIFPGLNFCFGTTRNLPRISQVKNELSARLKLFPGQLEHYFRNRRTQVIDRDV
jgi:hypothetical protein